MVFVIYMLPQTHVWWFLQYTCCLNFICNGFVTEMLPQIHFVDDLCNINVASTSLLMVFVILKLWSPSSGLTDRHVPEFLIVFTGIRSWVGDWKLLLRERYPLPQKIVGFARALAQIVWPLWAILFLFISLYMKRRSPRTWCFGHYPRLPWGCHVKSEVIWRDKKHALGVMCLPPKDLLKAIQSNKNKYIYIYIYTCFGLLSPKHFWDNRIDNLYW